MQSDAHFAKAMAPVYRGQVHSLCRSARFVVRRQAHIKIKLIGETH
jgi:hypothetical protein